GCDADITVFNPATVTDKATFEAGLKFSDGVQFVLVNGVAVVRKGNSVADVYPGKPLFGKLKR
ncbi:MAG: D-aminoacylase, partial [Cyclobacteriaceae bacterium]|nr:D-aminoacylase [Cyclobacteriaceae bacterium]